MTKRPTVLLGMPNVHGIYHTMAENLRFHGFDVINLAALDQAFRYPSLRSRLSVKVRRHLFGRRDAKLIVKAESLRRSLDEAFAAYGGGADYALFISADVYHPELLNFIRPRIRHGMVNYQWDGMKRFPAIWDCIDCFDRFYVFDPDDLNLHDRRFLPATNFYFDHDLHKQPEIRNDIYFTGTHQPARAAMLSRFADYAAQAGWHLDFNLVWALNRNMKQARQTYPASNIRLSHKGGPFQDNLDRARQSRVLADFLENVHQGLSFRTFEALGYRKKLITTNPHTARYDFYHPDNIYILNADNFHGLQDFLDRPCRELDPQIREKYGFGNWIRYVLDMEPYQKINLPLEPNV